MSVVSETFDIQYKSFVSRIMEKSNEIQNAAEVTFSKISKTEYRKGGQWHHIILQTWIFREILKEFSQTAQSIFSYRHLFKISITTKALFAVICRFVWSWRNNIRDIIFLFSLFLKTWRV